MKAYHFTTVACAAAMLLGIGSANAQLSGDDLKCTDAVYNGSRKVHQQEAKGNRKSCIKGQTSANQNACINADQPKSGDQAGKLAGKYGDKCAVLPAFGVNASVAAIVDASQAATDNVHFAAWGDPVDPDATDKCHDKVSKRTGDLSTQQWKNFRKCVKDLGKGAGVNSIADIEGCIASGISSGTAKKGGKIIDEVGGAKNKCTDPLPNFGNGDCSDTPLASVAQCLVDTTECETCLALNEVTGANADCSAVSGISCGIVPGQHKCTFDGAVDNSTLQICFLGVCPPAFDISGGVDIICDPATQDVNGKRDCTCPLQTLDPVVISGVGTVCTTPFAGPCGDGEMDCDGGNSLDVDIIGEHTAGVCTGNADCAGICGTYCSGIGKSVYTSGCEQYCQGGTRAGLSCICDTAGAATCTGGVAGVNDCPNGSCEGKDNDLGTNQCHCTCVDEAFGGAAAAGSVNCRTGVTIVVEAGEDGICDGNVLIRLPGQCAPFTSGTATGIILNDNENPGPLGPYSETGTAGTCAAFDASTTTGYEMVSVLAFYDSTIGDIVARLQLDCQ
jgi:hypothetical protein